MNQEIEFSKLIETTINYKDEELKVILTPEFKQTEDGLEWTEFYLGILIHPTFGTYSFKLQPAPHDIRWEASCEYCFDRELVALIAEIIEKEFDNLGSTW